MLLWGMTVWITQKVSRESVKGPIPFNPLNAELNPICRLLALLGGATIVVVSRLRVNVIATVKVCNISCCEKDLALFVTVQIYM